MTNSSASDKKPEQAALEQKPKYDCTLTAGDHSSASFKCYEEQKSTKGEDQLGEIGSWTKDYSYSIGLGLGLVLLILIFWAHRKLKNQINCKNTGADDFLNSETYTSRFVQTKPGLIFVFIIGTLISVLLGIFAVSFYKASGFDDGFAQGSGSLVQAIWGSAATIAAAFVAILLAMEAVQQSKQMNEFTKTQAKSNDEYQKQIEELTRKQTPQYKYVFDAKVARDELLRTLYQFDATFELCIQKNLKFETPAEKSALKLAAHHLRQELEEAKKTPLFDVLNKIPYFYIKRNDKNFPLKNFGDVLILLSVVIDHAFENDPSFESIQQFDIKKLLPTFSHLNYLALVLEIFVKDEKVIHAIYGVDESDDGFSDARDSFKEKYKTLIEKLSPDSNTEEFFHHFKINNQDLRVLPVVQELLSQRH